MLTERWQTGLVVACPLLLFAALFGRVAFAPAGHVPASQDADFFLYYYPLTRAAFAQWREHGYPEWNPLIYSGMPMALSMEIGLLYPPNWLHLVLSTERAFCLLYAFHVLLAGAGMWLYVRGRGRGVPAAAVSSAAYAFAAPTILHFDMGLTSLVYSSAWFPLLFALIDRCLRLPSATGFAGLVVALACQFLAGFPLFTLCLAALIPAYLLCFGVDWKAPFGSRTLQRVALFGMSAILALGLVLPQLWPAWEALQYVHRETLEYPQATHCSFPLPNLLTFFAPRLFGDDRACVYWGEVEYFDTNAWCGTVTLGLAVLALAGWRQREALPDAPEPFRVAYFSQNPSILPNRLLYERLEDVGGHENFVVARYSHFIHAAAGVEFELQTYLSFPNIAGCYDPLNVKYYLLPRNRLPSARDVLVRPSERVNLFNDGPRSEKVFNFGTRF